MARKPSAQAAALMEAERADREENADINEAIARTDSEVFTDAMGDEPLDDEAGTELEDMGEGLEGEELEEDEEEQQPEGEQQAQPEGEESAEQPGEQAEDEPEEDGQQPVDQRPPPSIPPRVLRETRERARETENELRAQLRDMQMRIDNLSRQPAPAPQPQPAAAVQQPPQQAPDMFADPDGYRNWMLSEAERRAEAKLNDRFSQMQQQQQQETAVRLNESLAQTASGPRSYEFNVAYRDLTSLDRTPENAALIRGLVANPATAGQAILDWWEQSSNPAYIEAHRDIVRQTYAAQRPLRGGAPQRQNGRLQNGQAPRHEVRLPRSLSEASGGRSQHVSDPEMMDGAEESIFAYGARR
jgi:hypothetical protein